MSPLIAAWLWWGVILWPWWPQFEINKEQK